MDHVEGDAKTVLVHTKQIEGVGLMELERISRLRLDVHAHDLEARAAVAHRRAAGTAEEIQEARFHGIQYIARTRLPQHSQNQTSPKPLHQHSSPEQYPRISWSSTGRSDSRRSG